MVKTGVSKKQNIVNVVFIVLGLQQSTTLISPVSLARIFLEKRKTTWRKAKSKAGPSASMPSALGSSPVKILTGEGL